LLIDTIQPFPTFSEIYLAAVKDLTTSVARRRQPETAGAR
jgi:hypothetical protein